MSRRGTGFTDAELAAAAWRRNLKLQDSLREMESKRNTKKRGSGRNASGHSSRKRGRASESDDDRGNSGTSMVRRTCKGRQRERSISSSSSSRCRSVDSLGRERRHGRSNSRSGSHGPGTKRRNRERSSLGRGRKPNRGSSRDRRRSWSSSSNAGSFSSDRGMMGDRYDRRSRDAPGSPRDEGLPPPDPLRPEHDNRSRGGRGRGWLPGKGLELGDRGGGFYSLRRRHAARSNHSSRSPGGGGGGRSSRSRSLSRSISRDRRSRRSSRSRSPSVRSRSRDRSRDRTRNGRSHSPVHNSRGRLLHLHTSNVIAGYGSSTASHKDNSSLLSLQERSDDSSSRARMWSHDMFDEVGNASPPRVSLPPGYRPEAPTWVSRAGGVYMPTKT